METKGADGLLEVLQKSPLGLLHQSIIRLLCGLCMSGPEKRVPKSLQ